MKTGRVLIVLGFGLPGLVGLIGLGCSAAGDPITRPTARGTGGAAGAETGGYNPYGTGGADDAGADTSAGGDQAGAGGYDPYGQGGASGTAGNPYGTGGGPSDAPLCNTPNTAANKLNGPNVWDGQSSHIDDTGNVGYWYSYYDGSSGVAVLPTNTSFGSGIVGGFIEASGTGTFVNWGGGIGASFFSGTPTPVADLSPYKGIVFQFINSAVSDAHFALDTWDFAPEYCCTTCYQPYGVDLVKGDGTTVVSFWMCWPGITCSGPNPDAAADFPNQKEVTLTSAVSGTVKFDPKRVLAMHFTSKGKTPWDFKIGKIRLF